MQFDISVINIFVATATAIGTVWLCWNSWNRSGRRKRTLWLEALRIALIAMAVFTLFQPEFVRQEAPAQANLVRVLCDQSGSMETEDVLTAEGRVSRSESIRRLQDALTWQVAGQRDFQIEPFAANDQARSTNLNQALEAVVTNPDGVRAVVLVSDGDWNTGQSPADAARKLRQLDIPVFAVAAGRPKALPDLAIERFDVPTFAVVGKPLRIPFSIRSTLPNPTEVAVTVTLPGQGQQLIRMQVPAFGEAESVVSWRPPKVGDEMISIQIPDRDLDSIAENNQQSLPISIRYESLKVLLVDSFPRWEYRYTRNALMRDPGVTVHTLLFQPDFAGVGGGPGYLSEFPTAQSLFEYDVVFLGDVGTSADQLTEEHCDLLRQLVQNHAGGLVLLPGFHGFQNTLAHSVLEELSPVEMDPAKPKGDRTATPAYFQLTESGRRSLLTRFETDEETNADVWRALPGFFWHAAALRSKPGSTTLAVHRSASNRFGRIPLIVTRSFGGGKVLFVGSDGAWQWRKGVEDLYHYRFWSQMVRWMAYQRTMAEGESLRVVFSPDRPRSGDTVTLQVNAMAESGEPLHQGNLSTQIECPDGSTLSVNLTKESTEAWGLFRGSFVAESGGKYRLQTRCKETDATLESAIYVANVPVEQIGRPDRLDVMHEIASITQGRMVTSEEVPKVIAALQALPDPQPVIKRLPLWSHPMWGGVMIGLLGLFWTGRKYSGLV
jgi:hypothetical protein